MALSKDELKRKFKAHWETEEDENYSPAKQIEPVVEPAIEPVKTGKYKGSGIFQDQMLKYTYPGDLKNRGQTSLWDSLGEETKKEIQIANVEIDELVEGIKLSAPQQKLIDCLQKLLDEKSQTKDPTKDTYYSGNAGYELVKYGQDITIAPKLAFTLYELAKEYVGGRAVGGNDLEIVRSLLQEIRTLHHLVSYSEKTYEKDGSRTEKRIEQFKPLIEILKLSMTKYSKDNLEISKKEQTVILLSPIFRRHIDSKFISYPEDKLKRTMIAYGDQDVPLIVTRLREYLIREIAHNRYNPEIYLDRLYYLLHEKYMRESRRPLVKRYLDRALATCKALGLLLSWEIVKGATGEDKMVFKLNKDWV